MQGPHTHLRAYLWLLFVLVLVCGFVYELYVLATPAPPPAPTLPPSLSRVLPAPRPQDAVSQQQPFQYLVSYTVSGFHPTTLSVKVGQTIRFTDNSPSQITIQGAGAASSPLSQGTYWQYTANSAGTLAFKAGNSSIAITVTD